MPDARALLAPILALHDRIRDAVVAASEAQASAALAAVDRDDDGDTIYAIDRVSEETLVEGLLDVARDEPLWVLAEGLPPGGIGLPHGIAEGACPWRVLVDPIDGTRGLMYQKRPAWVLTGVAPNRGPATRLRDIVLAVQTEIPLVKQHLSDQLWAVRGEGSFARRRNRVSGEVNGFTPRPSQADTIAHGFSSVVRFFPGARDVLAAIDDALVTQVLGPPVAGKAACFEDQYMSTGGQLYELAMGHDRFVADLRPEMAPILAARGVPLPLCCHPYDLCTALIAEQLGVVLTDADGAPLDGPFDLEAALSWVGYANEGLRQRVEPALREAIRRLA
ncbi:MAG: inositol monophosphatase, partial [Cytophagaceae bacterium]|nr:inositol monophosphatase [Gemmatimonadaceae bacterium]